jgi:hypothetical protein
MIESQTFGAGEAFQRGGGFALIEQEPSEVGVQGGIVRRARQRFVEQCAGAGAVAKSLLD